MPAALSGSSTLAAATPLDSFVDAVRRTSLSFDELLEQYCSLAFAHSGNVAEAARRLGKQSGDGPSRIRLDLVHAFSGAAGVAILGGGR
jgi:hypothetical protein